MLGLERTESDAPTMINASQTSVVELEKEGPVRSAVKTQTVKKCSLGTTVTTMCAVHQEEFQSLAQPSITVLQQAVASPDWATPHKGSALNAAETLNVA